MKQFIAVASIKRRKQDESIACRDWSLQAGKLDTFGIQRHNDRISTGSMTGCIHHKTDCVNSTINVKS